MSKKMQIAWFLCFALLLIGPRLVYPAVKSQLNQENTENRELAAKPVLNKDTYRTFPADFESYYNDRLAFRDQLITANSILNLRIFKDSASDQVVLGKENWLFYKNETENCIEDYKGTNLFTDDQLELIKNNLLQAEEYLSKRDIEFVLFIPPNKENVYGEYMPDYITKKSDTIRVDQLVDYLRSNTDIRVVYPKEEMDAYKDEYSLYWHYDTHWNSLGGYIGAKALLKELGIEVPEVEELTITPDTFSGYDLANMMKLKDYYVENIGEDVNYLVSGYDTHNMQTIQADDPTALIYQSDSPDERKLFMVRDSFAGGMAPVLASNFRSTYMPHWNGFFEQSQIEEQDPDIFVYELVERRLDALLTFTLTEGNVLSSQS